MVQDLLMRAVKPISSEALATGPVPQVNRLLRDSPRLVRLQDNCTVLKCTVLYC